MEGEDDGSYCAEEEEMEHLQACATEDYESDDESDNDDADYPEEEDRGSGGGGIAGELKQHALALLVAVVAAVAFHANMHGGFGAWREEIVKDWSAMRSDYGAPKAVLDSRYGGAIDGAGTAPHAAPSMDAIPASKRRRALERALGKNNGASKRNAEGHARAQAYKRTSGLSFCPTNADALNVQEGGNGNNLVEMEFILPLDPSVRVLHSYYLADALGTDSSMAYENAADLGSYESDKILNEIDSLLDANDGEGLMLDQIEPIVRSHLPSSLPVDGEHVCLLHQYSLNKSSGRSIRGTTKVYKQPHVSTFYRSKFATGEVEPNYGMPPASLTFTGYAAKFINLSPQPLNLYWDGGRMSSGPRAGEMHTVLVGTVPPFESIGTSSFPGHSFYLAPTYDKDYQLKRWMITEDEPVLYYDPLEDLSSRERREKLAKLTEKQRFKSDAWAVDKSFGRDYLIKTGRVWLANFPQPYSGADDKGGMDMWSAHYMDQTHAIETASLYFTSLPNTLGRLAGDDYLPGAEERRGLEMKPFLSSNLKAKETENSDSTMQLNLKVRSVAPRVLEAKKFLSPVEVQHLVDLASGTMGDVQMKRSTVSASNVNSSGDKKRGTKADARSSTGGWIHREQDVVVDAIFCRIADLLNIDESLMRDLPRDHSDVEGGDDEPLPTRDRIVEAMQLLRYGPGEEYSAHHDFTYPSIDNRYQPKRYATVLLYLTGEGDVIKDGIRRPASSKKDEDGLKGGETTFPRAVTADFHDGVKVEPQSGKAVVFYNTLPDGNMDDLSQHAGGKVLEGVKYVANVWVWDPIVN